MRFRLCVTSFVILSAACGSTQPAIERTISGESPTPDDSNGHGAPSAAAALPPRFVNGVMWSAIPRGSQTLVADVDGDGYLDLTATSAGLHVAGLSSGHGDGTFASTFLAHGDRLEAAFGHVSSANVDTGSAAEELVYLSTRSNNDAPRLARVTTLIADGSSGGFLSRVSDYAGYAGPFSLADLDADGRLDVLTTYSGTNAEPRDRSYVQALYGDGQGAFAAGPISRPIDGITTEFVRLADTDGDGRDEAILVGSAGLRGAIAVVDPAEPNAPLTIQTLPILVDDVLAVDLDGDRRSELVTLDAERKSLLVLRRTATAFEIVSKLAVADASYTLTGSIVAADIDSDGVLDLILAGNDTRNTSGYSFGPVALVFHGMRSLEFSAPDVLQLLDSATEFGAQVVAQDFDGDAQPELGIITYSSAGTARVGVVRSPIYEVL